jgi:NAD dependent epimerase/dehydratase family enzyme
MGRPSFVPAPAIAFKVAFGEMSTVLLNGQRAVPKRLLELGYRFRFSESRPALIEILG